VPFFLLTTVATVPALLLIAWIAQRQTGDARLSFAQVGP
jgi:hypothetical protein